MMELSKKHRILKNQYSKGILHLDDPYQDYSIMYPEESNNIRKQQNAINTLQQKKMREIAENINTNNSVNFCNRNYKSHEILTDREKEQDVSIMRGGRRKFPEKMPTKDNIVQKAFLPKLNVDKSLYLYNCLNGEKHYDIVLNTSKDTGSLLKNAFSLK